jgi:phosphoribosyl 1,2-cyclic phosphodiesterase
MGLRLTVLASGSGGNASLVEANGFGLLLDAGLGPRQLATRLAAAGASWHNVNALLLTHTHSDHWNERTLLHLHRRELPVWCHADHNQTLDAYSPAFAALRAAGLVRPYEEGGELVLAPGLRCRPVRLRHDGGATFGFRVEATADLFSDPFVLAYLADLGSWDAPLVEAVGDVDLLALEFNHDVGMEYSSGRQPRLIARVLGDEGHLSNEQAAGLLRALLRRSAPGRLRHVVQLHLSRECNRPDLAAGVARGVLAELGLPIELHTARQDEPLATLHLGGVETARPARRSVARRRHAAAPAHPWLPGLENA